MNCWHCGHPVATTERIGVRENCPACGRALHACRNCQFYDPAAHNQCRETMAERVVDKERFNFCDYFSPNLASRSGIGRGAETAARSKLEDLFKKRP